MLLLLLLLLPSPPHHPPTADDGYSGTIGDISTATPQALGHRHPSERDQDVRPEREGEILAAPAESCDVQRGEEHQALTDGEAKEKHSLVFVLSVWSFVCIIYKAVYCTL